MREIGEICTNKKREKDKKVGGGREACSIKVV